MRKWFQFWVDYFIIWVLLFSAVAYVVPDPFAALEPAILPGLAGAHYAAQPLVALPSALFSVAHNVTGSMVATIWRRTPTQQTDPSDVPQPPTPGS